MSECLSILTPQWPAAQRGPALFLDRDDTLMVNRHYLADPAGVELFPFACEGLAAFRKAGYRLILISNQSGLARGYFTMEQLMAVTRRLVEILADGQVALDAIYYCPHAPEEQCRCRKPQTGLIEAACRDFDIDLANSVMIGDRPADLELARNAHLRAVQFLPKAETPPLDNADLFVRSLREAACKILYN